MSMSDHIFWFAIDISWVTFGRLEVSGHWPLYLLVCTENAFFLSQNVAQYSMGIKANFRFFVVDKGIFWTDSLITELSKLKFRY